MWRCGPFPDDPHLARELVRVRVAKITVARASAFEVCESILFWTCQAESVSPARAPPVADQPEFLLAEHFDPGWVFANV